VVEVDGSITVGEGAVGIGVVVEDDVTGEGAAAGGLGRPVGVDPVPSTLDRGDPKLTIVGLATAGLLGARTGESAREDLPSISGVVALRPKNDSRPPLGIFLLSFSEDCSFLSFSTTRQPGGEKSS